ncbi:MAG: hypothetical protein J5848_01595 [Bacteroidales bacterium]|nr:hypothetical protein [Bacteroidales bacterium]
MNTKSKKQTNAKVLGGIGAATAAVGVGAASAAFTTDNATDESFLENQEVVNEEPIETPAQPRVELNEFSAPSTEEPILVDEVADKGSNPIDDILASEVDDNPSNGDEPIVFEDPIDIEDPIVVEEPIDIEDPIFIEDPVVVEDPELLVSEVLDNPVDVEPYIEDPEVLVSEVYDNPGDINDTEVFVSEVVDNPGDGGEIFTFNDTPDSEILDMFNDLEVNDPNDYGDDFGIDNTGDFDHGDINDDYINDADVDAFVE